LFIYNKNLFSACNVSFSDTFEGKQKFRLQ
jgi:hypothetical protein